MCVNNINGNRLTQKQEINRTRDFSYTENSNLLTNIKYYHMIDENTTEITKDINYTYDKMGNIIKDEKHTYGYDGRNRLISIDENIKYNYNHNNRRVTKIVNGVTTYFIYEGHKLLGEYDKDGNVINEYVYFGSSPIAMLNDEKTYKIYTDHLNTPRRVTDKTNNIVWKWESTPFGETKPIGILEFNLRFAGQYFDSETGTHYNINRDYNPVTGRYIQSDPIGLDGGVSTFAYVDGNPVLFVDLEGLCGQQNKPVPKNVEPTYPDPAYTDERRIRLVMARRLLTDIGNSHAVDSDIKRLPAKIRLDYSQAFVYTDGGYVHGHAKRSTFTITLYAPIWDDSTTQEEKSEYLAKKQLLDTMFHEIQHLRQSNYTHSDANTQLYLQQMRNFMRSSSSW